MENEPITLSGPEKEVLLQALALYEKEIEKAIKMTEKIGRGSAKATEMLRVLAKVEMQGLKNKLL